jgi:hypothetical protein
VLGGPGGLAGLEAAPSCGKLLLPLEKCSEVRCKVLDATSTYCPTDCHKVSIHAQPNKEDEMA